MKRFVKFQTLSLIKNNNKEKPWISLLERYQALLISQEQNVPVSMILAINHLMVSSITRHHLRRISRNQGNLMKGRDDLCFNEMMVCSHGARNL